MDLPLAILGSGSYLEMIIIAVAVLVLFGPRKLPEVLRQFGNIMAQLRSASREFKSQIMDVENQIREEVRDIERKIESETKELEDQDDTAEEYSFEDDPYHADLLDEANTDSEALSEAHNVWEEDYSGFECPEDRARRELEAAAQSMTDEAADSSESSAPELDGQSNIANGAHTGTTYNGNTPEGTVSRSDAPQPPAPVPASEIPPELKLDFNRPVVRHDEDEHNSDH